MESMVMKMSKEIEERKKNEEKFGNYLKERSNECIKEKDEVNQL
jgi:RNase H-fold protein (predicted Holliday junction resolvase)